MRPAARCIERCTRKIRRWQDGSAANHT